MLNTQTVWERVLHDVRTTTSLDLRLARCDGAGSFTRAFVAWRAGEAQPELPIETQWMDEDLSYIVIRDDEEIDGGDFSGHEIVSSVQDIVTMSLYAAGEDPTWPRCPEHRTHPLCVDAWWGSSRETHLEWRCRRDGRLGTVVGGTMIFEGFSTPVGTLGRGDAQHGPPA